MAKPPRITPLKPVGQGQFNGLSSWQLLLSLLPLALLFIGGAIGGAIGALGLLTNVKVAKAQLTTPMKVLLMAGVILTSFVVYLAIAAVVANALNS